MGLQIIPMGAWPGRASDFTERPWVQITPLVFERNDNGVTIRVASGKSQQERWNGNPLKLQLHHINGNHNDNRIENLQILCPNCHTQTDNFCGKNKNNNTNVKFLISRKIKEYATKNYCKICGKEITGEGKKYCSHKCAQLGSVQWNVDTEQLLEDFKEILLFSS